MRNKLKYLLRYYERSCGLEAGELLQPYHFIHGLAAQANQDGEAEAAVLVHHIQESKSTAIGRGVVWKFTAHT